MGRPKEQALRELTIQHHQNGLKNSEIFQMLCGKVSEKTIYRWIKVFNENGKKAPKKSTGRPRSASTQINKRKVKRLSTNHSGRQIAAKLNISKGSVVNIFKELNLKAYKKRKIPLLKEAHVEKRLRFSQFWRKNKNKRFKNLPIMFSDEKLFTVDGGLNKQNQRVYAISREDADFKGGLYGVSKFPLSVMVWIGLTEKGPTKPYIVDEDETINSLYYQRRILPFAKREGLRIFGTNRWVFQQDGAKPHTAKTTQKWCENNLFKFIRSNEWPPNSPDLNPCDYFFWNACVTNMKQNKFSNKEEFIEEIKRGVEKVPIEQITSAVNCFTKRVRNVEKAKGKYCHN